VLGKASKSENLLKNRSAVGCYGFFARNGVARMLWAVVVRGMLRIGDIADGKRQNVFSIFGDFVLLSEPREPDLELAVEHFFNF
jgi:hypothetical protein